MLPDSSGPFPASSLESTVSARSCSSMCYSVVFRNLGSGCLWGLICSGVSVLLGPPTESGDTYVDVCPSFLPSFLPSFHPPTHPHPSTTICVYLYFKAGASIYDLIPPGSSQLFPFCLYISSQIATRLAPFTLSIFTHLFSVFAHSPNLSIWPLWVTPPPTTTSLESPAPPPLTA